MALSAGLETAPIPEHDDEAPLFFKLSDFYDAEVEEAVYDAYQRDYLMFGFESWA